MADVNEALAQVSFHAEYHPEYWENSLSGGSSTANADVRSAGADRHTCCCILPSTAQGWCAGLPAVAYSPGRRCAGSMLRQRCHLPGFYGRVPDHPWVLPPGGILMINHFSI